MHAHVCRGQGMTSGAVPQTMSYNATRPRTSARPTLELQVCNATLAFVWFGLSRESFSM